MHRPAKAMNGSSNESIGQIDPMVAAMRIRRLILEQSKRAHVGHIGSALSIADIVAALYFEVLAINDPDDAERDRFILSKGHAALANYAALYLRGWISEEQLNSFCGDDSLLGVHPAHELRGIDFSTGSLGLGLSIGVGAALAARMQRSRRRVVVLMSDAECNEGSVWEAAMFAGHHRLENLYAIVDFNGQQALGYTKDILDPGPMAERWRNLGWDVREVDGHDVEALSSSFGPSRTCRLVLARTVFGRGVSFMERLVRWHYMPMSDDEYARAIEEVDAHARSIHPLSV